jgi:hypothetical protein
MENTALLLLRSCLLLWEHVYQAAVQKQPWYMCPSHGRCIKMAIHATIESFNNLRLDIILRRITILKYTYHQTYLNIKIKTEMIQ